MFADGGVMLDVRPGKGEQATLEALKSCFAGAFGETSKIFALKERSSSFLPQILSRLSLCPRWHVTVPVYTSFPGIII